MIPETEIIRDPIHGFIKYNKLEEDLINSIPFQRLRRIRQLAFANLVYPGAEHSRFSHSLGAMEFASQIFDTVVSKDKEIFKNELKWCDEEFDIYRQKIRIVALLHDIGHAPFSHATEKMFPNGKKHENYTRELILSDYIGDILDQYNNLGITRENIAEFFDTDEINENVAFLRQIFASELDADKMDYLLRDSLYAGVQYGNYDHKRILATICLVKNEDSHSFSFGIEEGGVHAFEGLILARYFMFTQVYFHPVNRVYELHLEKIMENENFPETNFEIDNFIFLDDNDINFIIKSKRDTINHCGYIYYRNHYKCAWKSKEHPDKFEGLKYSQLQKSLTDKYGDDIMIDVSEKVPYKYDDSDILVKMDNGIGTIRNCSKIIDNLDKIIQMRVYSQEKIKKEVAEFCVKILKEIDITNQFN